MSNFLFSFLSGLSTILALIASIILIIILPYILLIIRYNNVMFSNADSLPVQEYGVVFGARVYGENRLTDAAKERADAAIVLYQKDKINKIFVSGDNANDQEAENLAKHMIANGVPEQDIVIDKMGLDTHDTCKHLEEHKITEATLITQSFHLPRALLFCEKKVDSLFGVKANDLGLLENRGSDTFQIYYVRTIRFFRESLLTWAYLLGIYDKYSDSAEQARTS